MPLLPLTNKLINPDRIEWVEFKPDGSSVVHFTFDEVELSSIDTERLKDAILTGPNGKERR